MASEIKDTQAKRIIRYMSRHGSITTMDAFEMGITRLASRIYDIRRMGVEVESETVTGKNRFGEPVHYSRYKLV